MSTTNEGAASGEQPKMDAFPVTSQGIAHVPTRAGRRLIKRMVSAGLSQEMIAQVLEININTLVKHYRKELDTGLSESIALAERSLFRRGLKGDTAALIFWLKARAHWRDRDAMNVQVANIVPEDSTGKIDIRSIEDVVFKALSQMRPGARSKPALIEQSKG